MKKCSTLDDIIEYIQKKHRLINATNAGVHGFKLLRKPSGARILFEEIHGWRIIRHKVYNETTLIVETLATGLQFRGNKEVRASSKLFLEDLLMVNVYDHRTEFFSLASIDFIYIENSTDAELKMLTEWVNNDHGIIRAQWMTPKPEYNDIINEINSNESKIVLNEDLPRFINMDSFL